MKKDTLKNIIQDVKQELPTYLDSIRNDYPYIFKFNYLKDIASIYSSVLKTLLKNSSLPTKITDIVTKTLEENDYDPVVIGITGTVGKTSVAYLLTEYLKALGKKVTLLSSASIDVPIIKHQANICMPVPIKSNNFLKDFLQNSLNYNAEYIIIEVSEEALKEDRLKDIPFDIKVLTHFWKNWPGDTEDVQVDYFNNKKKFFTNTQDVTTFANVSSEKLLELTKDCSNIIYYGSKYNHNNISKQDINYSFNEALLSLTKQYIEIQAPDKVISLHTKTVYNPSIATNICCVISILDYLNILDLDILTNVINATEVPGRKVIKANNRTFIITLNYLNDINHVYDTLKNIPVIESGTSDSDYFDTYNKIKVLTGLPGWKASWRDRKSTTVEEFSNTLNNIYNTLYKSHSKVFDIVDEYYITNDNPGDYPPEKITSYLESIFCHSGKTTHSIVHRIDAIKEIVTNSEEYDIIFISGRASFESYEEQDETLFFTDEDILKNILEELKWL